MIKFRFKLDKVLRVRQLKVNLAKKALAGALFCYQNEQARLDQTMVVYLQASETLCQRETAGITAGDLRAARVYLDRVAEEVAVRQGAVKAALSRVDESRGRLVQAMKEQDSLEKLRDRRHQAYREEIQRQEQKVLDEVRTK